jgi:hypothetical protein
VPALTAAYLSNAKMSLTGGCLYGGAAAVGDDVLAELNTAIS